MSLVELLRASSRVHPASRRRNDLWVLEVLRQAHVVGEEKASTRDHRERDDVFIVRRERDGPARCLEFLRHAINFLSIHRRKVPGILKLNEPLAHAVPRAPELLAQMPSDNHRDAPLLNLGSKCLPCGRAAVLPQLACDVRIDDGAHGSSAERAMQFVEEELSVTLGCAIDVAQTIDRNRMQPHIEVAALEKDDRNVLR